MILQALVEYYEALEQKGKITSPGWCRAKAAYGLDISRQGELKAVIPLKQEQQRGKRQSWYRRTLRYLRWFPVLPAYQPISCATIPVICWESIIRGSRSGPGNVLSVPESGIRTSLGISAVLQPWRCAAFLTAGRRTRQQIIHVLCRNWRR